jgi:glycosyltransferase involved in cell wall biosynthesis
MRVFFDDQQFGASVVGGGGRMFVELIDQLAGMPRCEVVWFAGAYRTPLPIGSVARKCRRFYGVRAPALGPLRRLLVPAVKTLGRRCLENSGANIYHPTYYAPYRTARKIAQVVTIFDMNHECYPQFFPDNPMAGQRVEAMRRADAIVCISASTRDQLLEFHPEMTSKTRVIPLASSLRLPAGASPPAAGQKPYFLYVGNRPSYKNFPVLVEACRRLPHFARDFSLKCFGGKAFTADEQRLLAEGRLETCVEQLSGSDAMLVKLYRDAICLVYPSLAEGFGIPLLEAMNCRCAVLASDIPVFREVAGDAAAYFGPGSPEELMERMREMVADSSRKQELIRAGEIRAPAFSWQRCAQQHLALYEDLAGVGPASA